MNKRLSKILVSSALAFGIIFTTTPAFIATPIAHAALSIQDNRATADYWVGKNKPGEQVFVATSELEMLNLQIRQKSANTIVDLASYPEKVYPQWMKDKISRTMAIGRFQEAAVPKLFKKGAALTEFSYTQAQKNCGLDVVPSVCTVRYALTVDRTNIRLLPEEDGWFEDASDTHYDQLQATVIDPSEPVAVLVDSQDKNFVFVESRTYAGWVKPSALAFTDRATWLKYAAPKSYLTVIASRKTIPHGKAFYQMGGRVLLRANDLQKDGTWAITMPGVDANSTIIEQGFNIPNDNGVVKGALACSENNLIRQAFRFLGEGYGWGGLEKNVDCSSFVQDVYRSVGIELPRDTNRQEKAMARSISIKSMTRDQKLEILKKSKPGSLLFAPGHVMILLGTDDKGEPIVIHALSSYYTFDNNQTAKHYVRKVLVSDLHFMNRDKVEMIDRITSVGNF
ncbi:MAG: SH3 domain-containing protein [Selenomonadaceae bacterium]|nr:SH3 domain-containing protein [Selenomonadaceae bacterium]